MAHKSLSAAHRGSPHVVMAHYAGLVYIVSFSCLVHHGLCQGGAFLILSNNPVYNGELVSLTCTYGSGRLLVSATIDAFKGAEKIGSLSCKTPSRNTNGTGIFRGKHFQYCPIAPPNSTNVSLTITAYPSKQLDFNCSTIVTDDQAQMLTLVSAPTSLTVHVLPTIPQIAPSPGVFNEGDNATVKCESRNGTPTSMLRLTVSLLNGSDITAIGNESTLMTLPAPLVNWHNAVANCVVTNHNFANMSATSIISINHINCIKQPLEALHNTSRTVLNCSKYVSSYPIHIYSWSLSPGVNVTNSSFLRGSNLAVLYGHSGSINCTVTNNLTMKSVVVVFTVVTTQEALSHEKFHVWRSTSCFLTSMANFQPAAAYYLSRQEMSQFSWKEILGTAIPSVLGCAVGSALIARCIMIRVMNKKRKIVPVQ